MDSKFATLRPPECVLAGASGTHTVCVCAIHQNFKLKFEGASFDEILTNEGHKVFESYRKILEYNLCDKPTESCFLGKCKKRNCSDLSKLKNVLFSHIDANFIEEIRYKAWVQQERCSLIDVIEDSSSFIDIFLKEIHNAQRHDFIAKSQAESFRLR